MRIVLSFLCFTAFSQQPDTATLSGRVLDPQGATVAGATVRLYSRDSLIRRTTAAGPQGDYRFDALPAGEFLLEVQAPGFAALTQGPIDIRARSPRELDLTLRLDTVATRVLVTASGRAQPVDEISKALDVVDAQQMDLRADYSLMQALRLVPGLRVLRLGGPGTLSLIHSRGLRAFDTSVLIDGFRLRDSAAPQGDASAFLGDLLVIDTDRVEVLRGSGSSLYGTHATGAAVNIVTGQGGGPLHGGIAAEGGGLGMFRGVARAGGGAWDNRLQFSAGLGHLNVTRGVDGDDRHRNSASQGSVQIRLTPSTSAGGRIIASDAFLGLNDNPYPAPRQLLPPSGDIPAVPFLTYYPAPNDPDSRRSSGFYATLANLTHQFDAGSSFRIHYQGLITRRDNRDGPAGASFEPPFNTSDRFDGRVDTLQARTDLVLRRRHALSAAYEFELESYRSHSIDENPDAAARVDALARIAQRSSSVFGQDQLRMLADRLQVSFSGRLQWFQLEQPRFAGGAPVYSGLRLTSPPNAYTGDVAVSYLLPARGAKLRAHAGNGYRSPALYERFGSYFFLGMFSPIGDPLLRPERTIAFDAGIDQYLAASRVRVSASYFYTRLQEVIGYDSSGAITPATDPYRRFGGYRNTGGGLARGVETSLEAAATRSTQLKASYTFTKSQERISALAGGSLRSPFIPDHMFALLLMQRIGRRIDFTFDLTASGNSMFPMFTALGSRPFIFPGVRRADASIGYTVPVSERLKLRLYGRAENILNQSYYENGFPAPKAWAAGGMKLIF